MCEQLLLRMLLHPKKWQSWDETDTDSCRYLMRFLKVWYPFKKLASRVARFQRDSSMTLFVSAYICIRQRISMYVRVCVCMSIFATVLSVCLSEYEAHIYIHIYIYIHIHTHIHTRSYVQPIGDVRLFWKDAI
jgi:hypothetical protein